MVRLRVVTGYVPISNHPRSAAEYGRLGEELFGRLGNTPITPFYDKLDECWLWKYVHSLKHPTTYSAGDNPAKNTLAYHCVQHQKFGWLLKAAIKDPNPDVFVWMDYGIAHVPGVTPDVVFDFLNKVREDDFAIPGCWPKDNALCTDFFPCWRFCGGVLVVPRNRLHKLYKTIKREVRQHIERTSNVTWEVNTLARCEHSLNPRWYQADHNETMFTGYSNE